MIVVDNGQDNLDWRSTLNITRFCKGLYSTKCKRNVCV